MCYQPAFPEENNNITKTDPIKEFALLLVGLFGFFLLLYLVLGFFVDIAAQHISPELEADIFNNLPMDYLQMPDSDDPRLERLQQLTDKIRQCADIQIPIQVHLDKSDTINALALPGGHILLFEGLLDTLLTENSLSFVIGHELGHFKNRDHLRGMGREIVLTALAATFTGANSSLTSLVTPTVKLTHAQYSQKRETRADITGLEVLNCFYGHVGGATEFFTTMAANKNELARGHYFGSHPEMVERIAVLEREARERGYSFGKTLPLSFLE